MWQTLKRLLEAIVEADVFFWILDGGRKHVDEDAADDGNARGGGGYEEWHNTDDIDPPPPFDPEP